MLGGIINLLGALKPTPTPAVEYTMETTRTEYPNLMLIDYEDDVTEYLEFDMIEDARMAAIDLQEDEDICFLRIRAADGPRQFWEYPGVIDDGTKPNLVDFPFLILIDYQDHSTGYEEHDSAREATFAAATLTTDEAIRYFRVRHPDGTEHCWENPRKDDGYGDGDDENLHCIPK